MLDKETKKCFDTKKVLEYKQKIEALELELSFAMTIHKAQGSGWKSVYSVITKADLPMMNRHLLYTLVTRAKGTFLLGADKSIINKAIDNTSSLKRKTNLLNFLTDTYEEGPEKILEELEKDNTEDDLEYEWEQ